MRYSTVALALCAALYALPAHGAPIFVGQEDDFEDGTTQGWVVGLLGAPSPAPPINVGGGGPAGAADNYLRLTSIGGAGAGSKLTVINPDHWGGDYLAAGVGSISMDLFNFGQTDLALRLLIEDPTVGPPTNIAASSTPFLLPAGAGWVHATFDVGVADLTAVLGTVASALSGATIIRLFHNDQAAFPGPGIVAELGVDNITAVGSVPEPASLLLLGLGGLGAALRRRMSRA
jgi:hypothetical protein